MALGGGRVADDRVPVDGRPVPRGRGLLADDVVGELIHRTVARALVDGRPPREFGSAAEVTRRVLPSVAAVYRQSLELRVSTAVVRYFGACQRPSSWRFVGAEVNHGDVRLDLLFIASDGTVAADELKTGALGSSLRVAGGQLAAQDAAGRAVFGARWGGVRLVPLAFPDQICVIGGPR